MKHLDTLKSAATDFANKHPRLVVMLIGFLVANVGSQCAHRVDPKVGKVYDAVAPAIVTEVADALTDGSTSSTGGLVTLEPVNVVGAGGAGGK